ncbi:hypothetical protein UT300002_32170 [Clostridium perfringens]
MGKFNRSKSTLIELPQSCYSHSDAVNGRYLQKAINTVINLMGGAASMAIVDAKKLAE